MDLNAYTYSFPFKKPFQTSADIFNEREGLIMELKEQELTALGEAAPLPGFSMESLNDVVEQLKSHSSEIKKLFNEELSLEALQVFHRKNEIYPSLQFALDTLAVDYLSQKEKTTAQDYLFNEYVNELKTNGIVPISGKEKTQESVQKLADKGYETIKIKIGEDFQSELQQLKEIRSSFPEMIIRLDANRAWEADVAIENLSHLESLNIEYCEEPLAIPSIKNYRKLKHSTTVPLALDESMLKIKDWDSIMPFVSAVIIKPMVLGGLSKLFATNRLVNTHDNKVIYTTSLESGIGRAMTVILAAGLGSRNSAHGLSTGSLLNMDVWNDGTYINNGSVNLPDRSELGKRYHSNHKYLEPGRIDL